MYFDIILIKIDDKNYICYFYTQFDKMFIKNLDFARIRLLVTNNLE